jgi:hypothetical protein
VVAPVRQDATFVLRSIDADLFRARDAERAQLLNFATPSVFVSDSSPEKLKVQHAGRVGENRDPRRDLAVDQIGRLKDARTVGISRDNNGLRRLDRIV